MLQHVQQATGIAAGSMDAVRGAPCISAVPSGVAGPGTTAVVRIAVAGDLGCVR